jgi:hypothetical protein
MEANTLATIGSSQSITSCALLDIDETSMLDISKFHMSLFVLKAFEWLLSLVWKRLQLSAEPWVTWQYLGHLSVWLGGKY